MRHLVSAACGMWAAIAAPAFAESVVVVELYTSQGCSSCPPADALFQTLAKDPRVIPLALHVDYWDYIGWADTLASPKFTERQKSYARAIGSTGSSGSKAMTLTNWPSIWAPIWPHPPACIWW